MSAGTAKNGRASKPPPAAPAVPANGWTQWPTIAGASRQLGVSVKKIEAYRVKGLTRQGPFADGSYRFNPEELEQWRGLEDEISATVESVTVEQLKATQQHCEHLVEATTHALKVALEMIGAAKDMYAGELSRVTTRCSELESKNTEFVTAREALLNEQTARDIAARDAVKKEERKEQIFKLAMSRLPKLAQQIESAVVGRDPKAAAQVDAAIKLLQSVDPDTMAALQQSPLFSEEQRTLIDVVLGKVVPDGA
jgi:hypothetical protein